MQSGRIAGRYKRRRNAGAWIESRYTKDSNFYAAKQTRGPAGTRMLDKIKMTLNPKQPNDGTHLIMFESEAPIVEKFAAN